MENKIVIVIVLYNEQPPQYIYSSKSGVEIILVDNTPDRELYIETPNITYIPLHRNYGIAKALNVGFYHAKELNAEWVLTMDQDSILPDNLLSDFRKYLPTLSNAAVLVPQLNMYEGEEKRATDSYRELTEALTSGSLIRMEAFNQANGFKEELFIDGVDFEFCKHVRLLGWHVYQINSVVMQHHLGRTQEVKFFGRHLFYVTHHNYIRHYYMQRNSMYVASLYLGLLPEVKSICRIPVKSLFKILFFEKDKIKKLIFRYRGYLDFKNKKFGEYKKK